jgi:hypothetical protein
MISCDIITIFKNNKKEEAVAPEKLNPKPMH